MLDLYDFNSKHCLLQLNPWIKHQSSVHAPKLPVTCPSFTYDATFLSAYSTQKLLKQNLSTHFSINSIVEK
jgi:hypothetical protein